MKNLVKQAKRGNKAAFSELIQMNKVNMYKVARAILYNDEDVSDAIQDTILTCWEKLNTLKNNEYFKTWMTRILINNCYKIINTNTKELPHSFTDELVINDSGLDNAEWKDSLEYMEEKYRIMIILYYVQGYKIREIAKILDLKETTVKDRLKKAREQYKLKILGEKGEKDNEL